MCEHFSVESLFPELRRLIRPEHLFAGYYDVTVTFDLLDAKCHWFIFFSLLNFHLQLFVALFIWFVGQRCFTWGHSHLRHLYQMCVLSVRHIWVKTANKSLANDVNEPWSQTIDYTCVMFVFRVWADSVSVFQWDNHTSGLGPIQLLSQCKSNSRNIHWPLWACSLEPLWGSRCSGSDWVAPFPPSHPLGPVAALEIGMTEGRI